MNKKTVVFLDINIFHHERFKSGLLIIIKEMLQRLKKINTNPMLLSIAQTHKPGQVKEKSINKESTQKIQGVQIIEVLHKKSPESDPETYNKSIDNLLGKYQPKLIIMNTPAVFLEEIHITSLQRAIDSGAKVVVLLADAVFPTKEKHSKKDVDRYYKLLKRTKIVSVSNRLISLFYKETKIRAQLLPMLFSPDKIIVKKRLSKYITLINHHPVKGKEIFEAIVKKLPSEKFLIVENWPDVPSYNPPFNNIKFSEFVPDVRKLYSKIKILLVPSLWQEGAGRIIIESMLNEIPVIAHKIGGIPEMGGEYIFYVDPPPIQKMILKDTVLFPEVLPEDVDSTSSEFVKIIKNINKNPNMQKKRLKQAKEYASQYCIKAEREFLSLINQLL